jgi:hypothetical protein
VVERHDGDDGIKCADASNMLDRFPDQAWVKRSGRIHAERIEAKFPQTANQAAVTTAGGRPGAVVSCGDRNLSCLGCRDARREGVGGL